MSSTDRDALMALFLVTDGIQWRNHEGWGTDGSRLSEWYGIEVDDQGRVVKVSLYANNLQGCLPAELGELSTLEELELSYNSLTGSIPEEIGNLSSLRRLDLSANKLTGYIPKELGRPSKVETLALGNNQLTGLIPKELGYLSALKKLALNHNNLRGIPNDAAQGLQTLADLTQLQLVPGNNWRSPPEDIVRRGLGEIVRYLEAVANSGTVVSWKLKVVLVGAIKAGKTSLVRGMIHGEPRLCEENDRTKGVDVHVGDPCKPNAAEDLELVFWDFAGHSNYYHMHRLFLSAHALHLLVVDSKRLSETPKAYRGELVDVWLDALQSKVPGSSVLVVATQIDRLAGDHVTILRELEETVEARIRAQREQFRRACRKSSTILETTRDLIFHGIEAVSAADSKSILSLRKKLADLDALGLLVREGTIIDSGQVLYLEPTWFNELLRAILDHQLHDATMERFWVKELRSFVDRRINVGFPPTGTLNIGYLRFLWRNVPEMTDDLLFRSLVSTMSHHGVIFLGTPGGAGHDDAQSSFGDSVNLFVPVNLPSDIIYSELEECRASLRDQYRKEFVYEISQSYVPPDFLGLLMARFFRFEDLEFHRCWSRGAAFTMGGPEVLLHLNTLGQAEDEAGITANAIGQPHTHELCFAVEKVREVIEGVFAEHFSGLFIALRRGYPRSLYGRDAKLEKIVDLKAHIDAKLSHLDMQLGRLEDKLHIVARRCQASLARLSKLQSADFPYPSLVMIRPAAAVVPGREGRSLRARLISMRRRAKKLVSENMRLCFLCPFDHSEIPCGLDGNGYPLNVPREWIRKIRPALQLTAILTKAAIKCTVGMDIPSHDFLTEAQEYIGEELADRMVLDEKRAIETALVGGDAVDKGGVQRLVGKAYEALKTFMSEHECEDRERCVHFDALMQPVDDGEGGQIWVSNDNAQRWKDALQLE